jgi:hypothetical protein
MEREREDRIGRREHVPVVVLTTGETATTRVLAVLADTTVTGRDVAAVLARLAEVGRHFLYEREGVSPRYSQVGSGAQSARIARGHPRLAGSIHRATARIPPRVSREARE